MTSQRTRPLSSLLIAALYLGCGETKGIDPEQDLEGTMQPPRPAAVDSARPPGDEPTAPAPLARDAGPPLRDAGPPAADAATRDAAKGTPEANGGDAGNADVLPATQKCLPFVDQGPNCTARARPAGVRVGRSLGCGKPAPVTGKQTIDVCQGRTREFTVTLPPSYDPATAYPVIFAFHHAYGRMDSPYGYGSMGKTLGTQAIIVSPQALSSKSEPCFTTWSRNYQDDLALFDALYDQITTTACVDLGRAYATGLSSGGYFSASLGCHRADVLRAVAPVAGGLRDFKGCAGSVAAMVVVQAKDENLRQAYLKQNTCVSKDGAIPSAPDPKACLAYAGCKAGAPVIGCSYGHAWPSWATAGMWSFFQSLPPAP